MQVRELKSLIEASAYRPDPSRVAEAILRRPALRALLLPGAGSAVRAADRA
ncbi:MAG: hypothetical protein JST08_17390 [Actinobacteria bacterium]|nr:hypothetical protein [Actinomycetota bacterium]